MERIELGDRVQDKITKLKGIVVGDSKWLYGCRRLSVQPEESKDGKPVDPFHVDEPQLELIEKAVIEGFDPAAEAATERTHGPRQDIERRADVPR